MKTIINIFKKQPVLSVATIAMLITCFFVPPDKEYPGYFDLKTLACLFCTLEVVCGFARIHTFEILAEKIVDSLSNLRNVITGIVFITYIGSMVLANDMALLTFLPLGYFALEKMDKKKYMAYTFVLQNIAANLGGMITPFGNPQNLYLYSYFNIDTYEFVGIMFLPFMVSLFMIIIACLVIPNEPVKLKNQGDYRFHGTKTAIYSILFIISIFAVLRILPYEICTAVVTVAMLLVDRRALKDVNYGLLATFAVFFVFSGNMARIPAVRELFAMLIPGRELLFGVTSCQFISNVPSAVMLSHFTTDYSNLLVAVNIGGLGTPIASLASLITLSEYKNRQKNGMKKYILVFEGINFSFLIVLFLVQTFLAL